MGWKDFYGIARDGGAERLNSELDLIRKEVTRTIPIGPPSVRVHVLVFFLRSFGSRFLEGYLLCWVITIHQNG